MQLRKINKQIILFGLSLFLISCADKKGSSTSETILQAVQDDPSCSRSIDLVWKSIYALDESEVLMKLSSEDVSAQIAYDFLKTWESRGIEEEQIEAFADKYSLFYSRLAEIQKRSVQGKWVKRVSLIEFESLGSGLEELELEELHLLAFEAAEELDNIRPSCELTDPLSKGRFIDELKRNNHPLVYGAKKVMMTAYQDCKLADKAPLNHKSHGVEGIAEYPEGYPDGVGSRRYILNRDLLYNTHHYYGYRPLTGRILASNNNASLCLDQKKYLMIYDYGGKPATSTKANSSLNMFRNAVTAASPDLGTDCSGFVFSALASAGLKLNPDKKMVASHVYMIGANNLRTPDSQYNSIVYMPCLQKVSMNKQSNLQSGDIISTRYHTVIVGRVGSDPLGIKKAANKNRCSKISYKDFDYDLYHSDPGKGAIGIHHITSYGHLRHSSGMRKGLEALAQKICANSLKNKSTLSRLNKDHKISIVRHKNTPECKGPEVSLTAETCLSECD